MLWRSRGRSMSDLEANLDGPVLNLLLNRPASRNALSPEMRQSMLDQIAFAARSPDVRVVVLRGAGGHFCSGGDVSTQGGERTGVDSVDRLLFGRRVVEAITNLARPVVAVVEGYAVGAGFSLAMACDLVVAHSDARFSAIFSKRGLIPDLGSSYHLPRLVGLQRAKEMVMTGRMVEMEEAHRLGIVSHVWSGERFEQNVQQFVADIADKPTVALATAKRILNRSFESDLSTMLELETLGQALASQTRDHKHAVEAFRSKTLPEFTGR